jgi:Zn-dependent alcohol dehydrogenase
MTGEQPEVGAFPQRGFHPARYTAFGSWFYQDREFPRMVALYRQGLPVADLITHRYPLEARAEAFREFAAGRTVRFCGVAE